jgi:hypothetical protein
MRNQVVVSVMGGGAAAQEESKGNPLYRNIKPTAVMEDYEYEEEGKMINLRYPKNVPIGQIKRSTYKYKKITIQIVHPYRVVAYESTAH